MSKLDKKWIRKPYIDEELEKLACANGSVSCGLLQKLGTGKCGIECKQSMLLLNEIIKRMGKGKFSLTEIFDKVK